jgi:hypothetical protein
VRKLNFYWIIWKFVFCDTLLFSVESKNLYFLLNNQLDALIIQINSVIKLYMFRASSLPIIKSFLLYIRLERSSILTLLGSGKPETCMKLTSAECTVENFWWLAEKIPETCRVL